MGILIDARFYRGTHKAVHETTNLKMVARLIIGVAIAVPLVIFVILGYHEMTNATLKILVFFTTIPFFEGLLWFAFGKKLFRRLNLIRTDLDRRGERKQQLSNDAIFLSMLRKRQAEEGCTCVLESLERKDDFSGEDNQSDDADYTDDDCVSDNSISDTLSFTYRQSEDQTREDYVP
jgi:hypothetical protein